MLNTLNINLKTDIKTDRATALGIKLMSQDKNNNQFILRFTNGGEPVTLDDTYTVEILTKFQNSGASRLTSATIRQDYATWEFDTEYITQDEAVYNYVYVRKAGNLVVSADANAFYFDVGLSEIDKGAGRVAEVYDENYQKYLDEFKDNVDFEEIAQAESDRQANEDIRQANELLREENYNQKVDTAIVEADVVAKVDNKVTELTPQISNLTAQLAQKVDKNGNEQVTWSMASQDFKEQITGGNTAIVGVDSVNTSNVIDNAITPRKAAFFDNITNLWTDGDVSITGTGAWKNATYNLTSIPSGTYTMHVDSATGIEPSVDIYVEATVTNGTTNIKAYGIQKSLGKYIENIVIPEGYYLKVIFFLSRDTAPSGTITANFSGIYLFTGTHNELTDPKINSSYLDIPTILSGVADEVAVRLIDNETITVTKTNPQTYSHTQKIFTVEPLKSYRLNAESITGTLDTSVLNVELLDSSNARISFTSYTEINNIEIATTATTAKIKLYFYLTYNSSATGTYTATFSGVDFYKVGTLSKIYQVGYESLNEEVKALLPNPLADRATTTILPKRLYFAKNKQATIYYENVLWKNLNAPSTVFFNKGVNYNRQVAFKFDTSATSQTMTAQIAEDLKKGETKSFAYDVVDTATNNGRTTNMLFIGDSFTDIGSYVKETKTLLVNDGVTVNLIGTCGNSTFKAEGLSGGSLNSTFLTTSQGVARIVEVTGMTQLPSTGHPGQTYRDSTGKDWLIRGGKIDGSGNGHVVVTKNGAVTSDFANFPTSGTLTKQTTGEGDSIINYTNPVAAYFNPFINPSTGLLDLTNYINYWGFKAPNIVVFQFTWNDTSTWATDSSLNTLVSKFKTAVDHVHSSYPNAKVILSIEPCGSINGNKDWNGKKYSVLRLAELMLTAFEDDTNYNTWVKIAPSYAFVDLVYGYATGTVTPSERYTATEQSGGDGIHPTTTGMNQIADCIYPIAQHLLTTIV